MSAMANWWQSIRQAGAQIKEQSEHWASDSFTLVVLILVGFSAFGLGRLSAQEPEKAAIQAYERSLEAREQVAAAAEPMTAGGQYVASKNGSRYHFPWCPGAQQMNEANKVWFNSIEDALAAGYTPAQNCKGLK